MPTLFSLGKVVTMDFNIPDVNQLGQMLQNLGTQANQFQQLYNQFQQIPQQMQQQMQQSQQAPPKHSPASLDPIHSRFIEVYCNTTEGAKLRSEYDNMKYQWMLKNGHIGRLEAEATRLNGLFKQQVPTAMDLEHRIGVGAIEYAHQLAVELTPKKEEASVEGD